METKALSDGKYTQIKVATLEPERLERLIKIVSEKVGYKVKILTIGIDNIKKTTEIYYSYVNGWDDEIVSYITFKNEELKAKVEELKAQEQTQNKPQETVAVNNDMTSTNWRIERLKAHLQGRGAIESIKIKGRRQDETVFIVTYSYERLGEEIIIMSDEELSQSSEIEREKEKEIEKLAKKAKRKEIESLVWNSFLLKFPEISNLSYKEITTKYPQIMFMFISTVDLMCGHRFSDN